MPSRDTLLLPDVLTAEDNLEMPPMPDISFLTEMDDDTLNTPRKRRAGSRDINLADEFNNSQYLQNSMMMSPNKHNDEDVILEDDLGLELDFGEEGLTVEMGRDAPAARDLGDDIGDTQLDIFGKDKDATLLGNNAREQSVQVSVLGDDDGFHFQDEDGDIDMSAFPIGDDATSLLHQQSVIPGRGRISESPLSDIDPEQERQLEEDVTLINQSQFNPEESEMQQEEVFRAPALRTKKMKLLKADEETMISSSAIKAQQADRSKILKSESFLPRDPDVFALTEMYRTGAFVTDILNDGRSMTWAPELRGLLSIESVMKAANQSKRKRGQDVDEIEDDEGAGLNKSKSPRLQLELDLGEEDAFNISAHVGLGAAEPAANGSILDIPAMDDEPIQMNFDEDADLSRPVSNRGGSVVPSIEGDANDQTNGFDTTTAPLVHPEDSGPVSLGTTHAVHLLRDCFGDEAANSPNKRKAANVVFQDLLPEATTSKADATKMFFEVLVLATKDAIKVDQKRETVGGPIKIRGKRGLWGAWAEKEAGGQIDEELRAMDEVMERARGVAISA